MSPIFIINSISDYRSTPPTMTTTTRQSSRADKVCGCHAHRLQVGKRTTIHRAAHLSFFRNECAVEMIDKKIVFNWCAIGWSVGTIISTNKDARKKLKGRDVNFFHHTSSSSTRLCQTSNHNLSLDNYGEKNINEDGQWVLLAPVET